MRRLLPFAVALLAVLGAGRAALAQDATPAAGPAEPGCTVAPRSVDELLSLWYEPNGTPAATPQPAPPAASEAELPQGPAADPATVAAITATIQELVACINAGDLPRYLALFTDAAARQFGPEEGESEEQARAFLSQPPQPMAAAERQRLVGLRDARVLADGRVGAVVTIDDPTGEPPGPNTGFVLFVEQDDQWRIDSFVQLPPVATPATA